MKITPLTITILVISFFFIWSILRKIKLESIGIRSAIIWIFLWVSIGVGSIFPSLTYGLVELAQMSNSLYFILVAAVFILFALLFNLTSRIDKMKNDMGKIIREIAILQFTVSDSKKEKQDKKGEID